MRNKSIKWMFPLSVILALTLIFGSANHAFAEPPAHAEKVDVLVSFTGKPGPTEQALIDDAGGKVKRNYHLVPTIAASIPKGKLDSLRRNPKVTSIEEDISVQIIEEKLPWGVDRIDAEVVHGQNKGRGVKVAILDTGIDLDHPDLQVVGNVTFVPETTSGDDDNGHGTMVAGVVAALDNDIGVVGVAPEVELYSVKVLNQNGAGVMSIILSGIEWAVDNNIQVINMSIGGILNWPSAVRTALEKAYQAGIVLVAGAGNAGDQGIILSPARYEPVIAVGATDQQDARASFSCTGSPLELMAPGVGILSTSRGGGYSSGSGTSFTAPHVAGIAALLIASGVSSNVEVRQILQGTAEDLGTLGWDSWYGYGLVNAAEAVPMASPDISDEIPPTTRIELSGLLGNEGWYISDVEVTLTAMDNEGGSGVAETKYSLDGGETWNTYTSPLTFSTEGANFLVLAQSRDNAGNTEGPSALEEIKIDKTPPSVTLTAIPTEIERLRKGEMVPVDYSGTAEDSLSGLQGLPNNVLIDEYEELDQDLVPGFSGEVWVEAWCEGRDKNGRTYIIRLTATDYAGNSATAETIVTVPHDRDKKEANSKKDDRDKKEANSKKDDHNKKEINN